MTPAGDAVREAALDAEFGTAMFSVTVRRDRSDVWLIPPWVPPTKRVVHRESCRFGQAAFQFGVGPVRANYALGQLEVGAAACGSCKPTARLLGCWPGGATRIAAYGEKQRHLVAPLTVPAVRKHLDTVLPTLRAKARGRKDVVVGGFFAKQVEVAGVLGVRLTYGETRLPGSREWPLGDAYGVLAVLQLHNLHVAFTFLPSPDGTVADLTEIVVFGSSIAQREEALYVTLDPQLLFQAARLGIDTLQALEFARTGDLTIERIGVLEALSGQV